MAKKRTKRKKMGNPAAVVAATKAAPKIKNTAKQVNKDTKGALSWVLVLGVAGIGYAFWRVANNASKASNVVGNTADLASAALDEATQAITDPNLDASDSPIAGTGQDNLTISPTEAQNRANLLLDAMDWPGTNFERVKQALSNITVTDYVLIAEKFGQPRYDAVFGRKSWWPSPKRNLSYWLAAELDNNEIDEIRQLVPGMF